MSSGVRKAVIPVAGVGTRMLPITKSVPKTMLPIVDKPIIQYLVEEAVSAGIEEIVIVLSKGQELVKEYFAENEELEKVLEEKGKLDLLKEVRDLHTMAKIDFVYQDQPLGDGHAILCAREKIGNEPFLVLFGDDLVLNEKTAAQQLVEAFEDQGSSIIGLQEVPAEEVLHYGIIDSASKDGNLYTLQGMVEKPNPDAAPSNLAIIGKYVCTPEIFPILEENPRGKDGEIRLIDGFLLLIKDQPIHGLKLYGKRFDTGKKQGYIEACTAFASLDAEMQEIISNSVKPNL